MPTNKHPPKKFLFIEPTEGKSTEELTLAILKQLEKHKIKNKRRNNEKQPKKS